MAQPSIKLKNDGDKVFEDFVNGDFFTCDPGETFNVPKAVAKHWIGDWEMPDVDDDREKELKRVMRRRPKDDPCRLTFISEKEPPQPKGKETRRKKSTTIIEQDTEPEFPGVEKLKKEATKKRPAKKVEPMKVEPATKAAAPVKKSRLEEMAQED